MCMNLVLFKSTSCEFSDLFSGLVHMVLYIYGVLVPVRVLAPPLGLPDLLAVKLLPWPQSSSLAHLHQLPHPAPLPQEYLQLLLAVHKLVQDENIHMLDLPHCGRLAEGMTVWLTRVAARSFESSFLALGCDKWTPSTTILLPSSVCLMSLTFMQGLVQSSMLDLRAVLDTLDSMPGVMVIMDIMSRFLKNSCKK